LPTEYIRRGLRYNGEHDSRPVDAGCPMLFRTTAKRGDWSREASMRQLTV
jgi:hypothetical protein